MSAGYLTVCRRLLRPLYIASGVLRPLNCQSWLPASKHFETASSLLCSRSGQSLPMFPIPTRGRPVNPREQKIWTFWKRQTKMWRFIYSCVRRKLVSQPAIQASCSWHVLAHKSFQLVPKPFLISRIDYNPSVIWISPKNSTCLSGKLRTKITSSMAKSSSPRLLDTTFFACCIVRKKMPLV